jgi:hypothetical protein
MPPAARIRVKSSELLLIFVHQLQDKIHTEYYNKNIGPERISTYPLKHLVLL